jgi:GNAT superfamily N-acetyltransferase
MHQSVSYHLRSRQPSDVDWIVLAHSKVRSEEFGFNKEFESMVEGIVAEFARNYDPKRERCWIAEMEGKPVGCVFLVKKSDTLAKLRLLLVEPRARGLGIGSRLVEECVAFARKTGYRKITLGTNDVALTARRLYEKAGFHLVDSKPHHAFGRDMVDETWDLELPDA